MGYEQKKNLTWPYANSFVCSVDIGPAYPSSLRHICITTNVLIIHDGNIGPYHGRGTARTVSLESTRTNT